MKKLKKLIKKAWQWRLRKKWHAVTFTLASMIVIFMIFSNFHVALTESVGKNLFYIDTRFPQIKKGDYVTLDVTYPYGDVPEDITVTKIVGCVPGQYLKVEGLEFYCDGKHLGTAKEETLRGKKTKVFQYDGIIPYGRLFLIGPHEYSFDSKYFGLVEVTKLKMSLKPVF